MMTPDALKEKQRAIRDGFPKELGLRVHRAISWLQRADAVEDDPDVAFILLWIAFNASYAEDHPDTPREKELIEEYFDKVLTLDQSNRVSDVIWTRFSGPIRVLLNNKYVYQPYWGHLNGIAGNDNWEERFHKAMLVTNRALQSNDTKTVLTIMFNRLYVLRNQLIHGGATWNSRVNRAQVHDGCAILSCLLPCFVDLMMDHPNEPWGLPYYPVVDG